MHRMIRSIYHFSGLRYVVLKFTGKPKNDVDFEDPPSGVLWLVGIYIAAFGISSQQYSQAIETEKLLTAHYELPTSADTNEYCAAMYKYNAIVMLVPIKPKLYNPMSILRSIFSENVPSTDLALTEAREIEEYTSWLLRNAARFVQAEERNAKPIQIPNSMYPQGSDLRLNMPYHYESINIDTVNETFEVQLNPWREPDPLKGLLDANEIQTICENVISPNTVASSNSDINLRNDCVNLILKRACYETKAKFDIEAFRERFKSVN